VSQNTISDKLNLIREGVIFESAADTNKIDKSIDETSDMIEKVTVVYKKECMLYGEESPLSRSTAGRLERYKHHLAELQAKRNS
jgi:hypothetical protein